MITIAIPFFNDEKYLGYAIRSVMNQSYSDWRLLLVNDGSVDGSLEIARKYSNIDERISIISDGENRGLPYRLNQIASLTTTRYLARMDADDIMHPQRIKTQLDILQKKPEIDLLGSNAYSIDDKNNVRGIRKEITNHSAIEKVTGFIHPTITGKTEWFKNNPYNEKAMRMQDTELWRRTHRHSYFAATQAPLLFYREFGGSYYKKYRKITKTKIALFGEEKKAGNLFEAILSACKFSIYYLFNLIGHEDYLVKKRASKLSCNEKTKVCCILNSAISKSKVSENQKCINND